jgi:nucleoid-associated protein YgaU
LGAVGIAVIVAALVLNRIVNEDEGASGPSATETTSSTAPTSGEAAGAGQGVSGTATDQAASSGTASSSVNQTSTGQAAATSSSTGQAASSQIAAVPTGKAAPGAPSFDIVRINPKGDAVIAGRAQPGADVTVLVDNAPIGTVQADSRGEWVLLPSQPLPPGNRQLSLSAKQANQKALASEDVVVLVVPGTPTTVTPNGAATTAGATAGTPAPAAGATTGPVAVLLPGSANQGSTVLQTPTSDQGAAPHQLSLDVVDYDDQGRVIIGGHAAPGMMVQLYIDNVLAGRSATDAGGLWQVKPSQKVAPGLHSLRADEIGTDGKVIARVEMPFSRSEATETAAAAPGTIIVQPGNSLWRLARRSYGKGTQYAVIFEANKEQIRNPDLIYPGQVFNLPKTE